VNEYNVMTGIGGRANVYILVRFYLVTGLIVGGCMAPPQPPMVAARATPTLARSTARPTLSRLPSPTASHHAAEPTEIASTQPSLYERIPPHFTAFSEPRVTPACAEPQGVPGAAGSAEQLPLSVLKNATYLSSERFGPITLRDGLYHDPDYPEAQTQLIEPVVHGDIDQDGIDDVIVMLKSGAGGTGIWHQLAVVRSRQGQPEAVATIYFSDREQVNSVAITGGVITVDATVNQPGDSLCCPSRRVHTVFRLCQGELVSWSAAP
jgi:hypothetical protein